MKRAWKYHLKKDQHYLLTPDKSEKGERLKNWAMATNCSSIAWMRRKTGVDVVPDLVVKKQV